MPKNFRLIVVPLVVPLAMAAFWSRMCLNNSAHELISVTVIFIKISLTPQLLGHSAHHS